MKLSEFIGLTEEQKRSTVLTDGVAVAQRDLNDHIGFLFQFPEYYVEALCNRENLEIDSYVVFRETRGLAPYLDTIPISDIFA